ncbi:MAG: Nif3-like dinuclear metal center hexameric protein [Candidatus Symbiothrix sp.]|jgi:dinuclear metal center YbgI/SA1388 family protein|nr:Nif3-like dinuclear metal center hexameric protein [Candidatus Symbiothrix sp.]
MNIEQIIVNIEAFAPLAWQDDFDNSGLQVGNIHQTATGALLCLDVTEDVVDEALDAGCNLIISHHPLLFHPLRTLTGKTYIERCVMKACKHDLVIYAAHTNLDNAFGGVNFCLAEKIGLENPRILKPKSGILLKLVTFVPKNYAEEVRTAMFRAGAGHIGNYDMCSYNLAGEGSFRAGDNAQPFVGDVGELHLEQEIRIETIVPAYRKSAVEKALLLAHPYEEPAYDFYPLQNEWERVGSGVIGELSLETEESTFLEQVKATLHLQTLKHSPFTGKTVRRVAICGGSGAFLIPDAIAQKADVFLTGEARYNDYYNVEDRLLLAVSGHFETEQCTKELFFDIISKKMPNFALRFSKVNTNPINYM